MNRRQRALAVRKACARHWKANRGRVADVRDGYRLVYDQEPDYIRNAAGQIVGVDAWVHLYDPAGHEVPIDPHRRIINPPLVHEGQTDPATAFRAAVWDSVTEAPNPAGHGTRGTVTTVYSSTSDGRIESGATTYSSARSGAGFIVTTSDTTRYIGQWRSGSNYYCYQGFISFDTSAIPDSDVVTAVDLAMWLVSDDSVTDFVLEAREKDWGASLTSADYVPGASLSGLPLMATLTTSSIGSAGSYKTFTSQAAFLSATNLKTGVVYLVLASDRQRTNTAPSGDEGLQLSMADTSGTTQDPRLTITHQAGSITGSVGQATETDTSQTIRPAKRLTTGQPSETDTAQPITGRKERAAGQAAETDTALPITGRKVRAVGQAAETDTALGITGFTNTSVGQAVETDSAFPITGRKIRALGQAAETDTALPIAGRKVRAIGQAAEIDTAQPLDRIKIGHLGQAVEIDTALRISTNAVGQAVEIDTALPITPIKSRSRPTHASPPYTDQAASSPYTDMSASSPYT